ncbi:MAG: pyruvate kinase [Mycobacterium sp.]|uniref:pyruvate kinase n=1 Tax=Mycobacterium sp. TaxID=1785 RepID=UPI00261DB4B7|nr:pyruvate kinase [Mycobacterium sp.]MDI3315271.1 pyruvate kinase [Mycobacterium sp.]
MLVSAQPSRPEPPSQEAHRSELIRPDPVAQLLRLENEVNQLLNQLGEAESLWSHSLATVAEEQRISARNLVHYWAIRQNDLRDLQSRLAAFGLSSLGRSEAHVEATLLLVRSAIGAMRGNGWHPPRPPTVRMEEGIRLLRQRTIALLGPQPMGRVTRIMVTLPSEAAENDGLVRELMRRGMNLARINCAHDDARAWRAMARNVRGAAEATGRACLIAMDLAGPKLRTGPLQPGPRVVKLRPRKNPLGEVVAPGRAWLTAADEPVSPPQDDMPTIPVPRDWLGRRRAGEVLRVRDTRGSARRLVLHDAEQTPTGVPGLVITADKTTYLGTGTVLHVDGDDDPAEIGKLAHVPQSLLLHRGDILKLTRDCTPAPVQPDGVAQIGCTLPEIFEYARPGESVQLDDGRIGGHIVSVDDAALSIRIDHAADGGSRLGADKGINVPDTHLPIPALTAKDIEDLSVVAELADVVEMSFVRHPSDVERLLSEVDRLGAQHLGIILKIETRQAFEHLPQLLLTVMRHPRAGVMIARGDLAVECGFDRLAELQEEILWLCEAGHLPVVWATQVLEQLAKTGNPSRAEISDAAMSERAECVMLNKGPYIGDAVVILDKILRRMAGHHQKRTGLLRSLRSWRPTRPA